MERNDFLAWIEDGAAPEASVLVPHEAPIAGRTVAFDAEGIVLAVAREVTLVVGERVRLELAVGGERLAVMRAVIAGRDDLPAERRYQFCFVSKSQLDGPAPSEPRSAVDRRRSERTRLAVPLKIGIYLPRPDGARDAVPTAFAMLDGASREGCSFVVDAATERQLTATERVLIEVRRGLKKYESGTTAVWRVAAVIAHRRVHGDGDVRYGCRLDPEPGREAEIAGMVTFLQGRELEDTAAG